MSSPIKAIIKALVIISSLLTLLFFITSYQHAMAQGATCAAATNVVMNGACAGSCTISDGIEAATPVPSCGTAKKEGWYKFTATGANATITAVSSSRQLLVQVFSGACGSLTEIGCANNNTTAGSQTETVTVNGLTIGTVYYIRIVGEATQNMGFTSLCIVSATYCTASGGGDEYISGVVCGSINNTGTTADGYHDYTAMSTTMSDCATYTITVTNGSGYASDQCAVWIDWNQDGDFYDANETITITGTPGTGPYTGTITVPSSAVLGNTRMRVRIAYTGALASCGTASYGEVEDYTINVVAGSVPKSVSSITVTQASNATTYSGATNQAVLGIAIAVNGSMGVLNLNSITVNSNNTSDADICGVKLYVTPTNSFATTTQIGGTMTFTAGTLTLAGLNYNLPGCSTTYVWVVYDICAGAVNGHTADAIIPKDGISIGSSTYPNSNQSPAGNRPIVVITPGSCSGSGAIMNGRFEAPAVASGTAPQMLEGTANLVWQTTASDNLIEIWSTGYDDLGSPFTAYEGNQSAEINATMSAGLYQDIVTVPCTQLTWSVAHKGRLGTDTMGVYIGPPSAVVLQRTCGTDNSAWVVYTGTYNVPAGQFSTRFEFRAISTSGGENSVGNLIDDVQFYCTGSTVTVNSSSICSGVSTSLNAVGGTSYTWSHGLGSGNPVTVSPAATTTYSVTASTSLGCSVTSTALVTVNGCLPVNIISFEAGCLDGIPYLNWATASETNNDYFLVEGSDNGVDFTGLDTVNGAGNSNSLINYGWTGIHGMSDMHYYRLKQTDFDGGFKYLGPVAINGDCNFIESSLAILNNPVSDQLGFQLTLNNGSRVSVLVYDACGKQMIREKFDALSGVNTFSLNLSQLPSGVYFLYVEANGYSAQQKFVR